MSVASWSANCAWSPFTGPAPHALRAHEASHAVHDLPSAGQDPRLVLATAREALEEQRWDQSADAYAQLLAIPRFAGEARYGLGAIALAQGSRERAEAFFREAVESDQAHANARYGLGRLAEERSVDEAISHYRRALSVNPEHSWEVAPGSVLAVT